MPAVRTAAELLAEVRHLGLVERAKRLEAFEPAEGAANDLAARLVAAGLLTPFQSAELLAGNGTGLLLKQYVLLDRVGAGGMGEVFRARHKVLGRIDAVKRIRAGRFAGPDAARRFRQEARLAARCSHPNLVTVYDADEADGQPFIAMEFVPGTDLHRLVRDRGALDPGAACECVRQAALGLHHAHEQGLIHRDVKPANLLLADGRVRVTDLGLARAAETDPDDGPATESGVTIGTPDFLAPEQCTSTRVVDRRLDLYSLGCTLYFLLTGRPPFPGGTATEKLLRHLTERPTPVRDLCPAVPVAVSELLDAMLAREPENRPATAEVVAGRLAPFCSAAPAPSESATDTGAHDPDTGWAPTFATPRSTGPRSTQRVAPQPAPPPPDGRDRGYLRVIGLVVLALSAVVAVFVVLNNRRDRDTGEKQPETFTPKPPTELLSRKWKMAGHKGQQGRAGYALAFSPKGDRLVQVVGDSTQPANPAEVRLWGIAGGQIAGDEPLWAAELPANTRSAAFAPDGSVFAAACGDLARDGPGVIALYSPASNKPVGTADHAPGVLALAFSPRGGHLLSGGRDGKIRVWDVRDPTKPHQVAEYAADAGPVQALAFNPDGTRLASGDAEGAVKLWSGELWKESESLGADRGRGVRGVGFVSGGTVLVAAIESSGSDGGGAVRYWDLTGPRRLAADHRFREQKGCPMHALAVAPDDRTVLVAEMNPFEKGLVRLLEGNPPTAAGYLWYGLPDANTSYTKVYCIAVSPDGTRIAISGADANLTWWEPAPDASAPPPPR